jgi:hypothetical protein
MNPWLVFDATARILMSCGPAACPSEFAEPDNGGVCELPPEQAARNVTSATTPKALGDNTEWRT